MRSDLCLSVRVCSDGKAERHMCLCVSLCMCLCVCVCVSVTVTVQACHICLCDSAGMLSVCLAVQV